MASSGKSAGIGFTTILFIVFLVLKLAEIGIVANWSWWWVTSPLWIPICLIIAVLMMLGIMKAIIYIIENQQKRKQAKTHIKTEPEPKRDFNKMLEAKMKERRGLTN